MKALRTKICTYAIALLTSLGFATPSWSGSSDFSGIWVAGHASLNVVAIDGTHTDSGGEVATNPGRVTQGTVGGYTPMAGWSAGFNFPVGPVLFVTVGYEEGGGEKARILRANDSENNADVTLHVKEPETTYIAVGASIFDNSAIYVKFGETDLATEAIGDVTGSPNNLTGDVYGIGTQTIAGNGIFLKTEAGAIQYDQFKITGIGGSADAVVEGDPLVGYGQVSLGWKF